MNPFNMVKKTVKAGLYLLPVRVGDRRNIDLEKLTDRVYSNRRDRESGLVVLGDVVENVKTEWWGLTRRTPEGGAVMRDKGDNYNGSLEGVPLRRGVRR